MLIIPAVDMKNKKCVQLIQGNPDKKHVELDNPPEIAKKWVEQGAEMLHLVDLDGAINGKRVNDEFIEEIIKNSGVPVQIGGGIRSVSDALYFIEKGAEKVILGTVAIQNPKIVREISSIVGKEKVTVALDAKDGKVLIKGWTEKTDYSPVQIGKILENMGAGSILFTNVDSEGLLEGINVLPTKELVDNLNIPIIASGGVTTVEDLLKFKEIGVYAVVVGSALYKDMINLKDAILASK
ncbi:phosphoribosylformimino-5-aminoimidazole carboxamide ribotide isomerase [Methanococcus vannielii SB]|jgi:phosphoribosylformimino-5-aminoimidazole carboxamide ribotide isomerase|uniref:1-(5-phosphoribosyl)-5-[(5-phosphoribosylamino)methylideneamino] imidazole-4-carboxamide isomerase n=1 Tax=Methanococcus vannielii (strain ATCC 35089 / DSM 1224 / JCM 13029 / OCM 148 / SB) TaxID=406327 RepID=HIS4_METVS|nr:1-(5-phosphoribosyl)-5-[(5-phosphoribosylamino)methylideneamino]imidazole-4-carboxamide isomerase [Methanococcus vannielii]A6US29.1 RecName: Full=1-(5-phosphoribosyl)-5-[(5-phosphoribosylamino)methylideneamino] imidazole-4-carboxamide isomerase; AltName: Full=Phosphoribosylformimino-5-aminoimidazole carboxamide ribotide isomerase [Methanococcus vannielii SB]ABR55301.1 phosphoribosylformimino-5-aminoimidazole carboxamide ribotide isomerase [Methanococcus vannielii SB]